MTEVEKWQKLFYTARNIVSNTEEVKRLTVLAEITAVACGVEITGFIDLKNMR